MTSITIAVCDSEHPVPGVAVEALADLFCMHDHTVRRWITEHRPPASAPGTPAAFVLAADPEWVNPGDGTESLTVPVDGRDARAFAAIWAKIAASCEAADDA